MRCRVSSPARFVSVCSHTLHTYTEQHHHPPSREGHCSMHPLCEHESAAALQKNLLTRDDREKTAGYVGRIAVLQTVAHVEQILSKTTWAFCIICSVSCAYTQYIKVHANLAYRTAQLSRPLFVTICTRVLAKNILGCITLCARALVWQRARTCVVDCNLHNNCSSLLASSRSYLHLNILRQHRARAGNKKPS